ncbi:MAG TPA: NAD(+)/NADH kinase [bacterium]|nr:NAD(+)/NADH kinase [bacterium]
MTDSPPLFKRIAIAAHPKVPEAPREVTLIAAFLDEHGVLITHSQLFDEGLNERVKAGEFDLLIALGGDGTMLRAGHLCGPAGIPVLGINLGRFGFLMEVRQNQWREIMPRLLQGDYWVERRMMLCVEQWRSGELIGSWEVLNEVFVGRGQTIRPVHLITEVDKRFLTTYVADGLIASTPTGSTAYALAAGGPILPPELRNILLVAVAPHLSVDRPIVLAEGSTVSITIRTDHQAILSVDGQFPIELADEDRVTAYASEHTVQFIRFQDPGYFYRNLTPHMNQNPSTRNQR